MMKWFLLVVLGIWVALPAAVQAQNREKARLHFETGERLYRKGEFEKAVEEYKKVLEYIDSPEMYYNIAQCYRMLKEYDKAIFFYRRYLSHTPDAPLKSMAEKHIAALERQLEEDRAAKPPAPTGPAKVMVTVQPHGAFVWVDRVEGRPAGTTPLVLELPAGEHRLVLKKEGYLKRVFPVAVQEGQLLTVDGQLEMDPDAPILPDPDRLAFRSSGRPALGTSFWVGAGATGVFVAGTALFGTLAVLRNREWKRTWDPEVRSEGRTFGNLATGFAVAAAGGALFTLWRYLAALRRPAPPPPRLLVAPALAPGEAGVFITFSF